MLKWFSNEESGSNTGALAPQEGSSSQSMAEITEQLAQTQQLVAQLKDLIREKDSILQAKDEQHKTEKDSYEAKLSKMRLQNKAKITSLNAQLEALKKQLDSSGGTEDKLEGKKNGGDREQEQLSASRGKILLLRKRVEELEHQLSQREAELIIKTKDLETQTQRGFEMDAMLAEKERKLAEKEAYIVDLQMSAAGDHSAKAHQHPTVEQKSLSAGDSGTLHELQRLVENLTKKVGESEEKYSLLQEQTESLKELLVKEKAQFEEKENMYKRNIQTFKDIILQKDNRLIEIHHQHEQELFRLAAKSDASADLEQLLKALKQKLHEKEEVLLGRNQVIGVLQGEVDARELQIKELVEKMTRLQGEKDNMQSKLDAEKHVMRAQLRDLVQKHQTELQRAAEKHESEMSEKEQSLRRQLAELHSSPGGMPAEGRPDAPAVETPVSVGAAQKLAELEAQVKLKAEEASKSEAKFLKMKAWSKSRIKQLEDDLRRAQSGDAGPDVNALQSRISDLEEERQEFLCKLDQYDDLKTKNDQLNAKLVLYEEQQRKLQADLEQVTKRAASQTSESGSADDLQSQVLEWQDMVLEAESARDQPRGDKAAMALRMSHIEEEREALDTQQQELEEDLAQARGLRLQRAKKSGVSGARSLQEDFEFDGKHSYRDPKNAFDSTASTEGENMGGWWPEYTTSDTGLRSVVEELELERNQLQEQILGLEERCQGLEDRLQMQARIESLQTETERLQAQLASLRCQQNREMETHQLLVASLNEQLKGLSEKQECLETSLVEKEHTLAEASEKLELLDGLRHSLKEKESHYKEATEKLHQTEHSLIEVTKKCSAYENQCSELKKSVADLTQKTSVLKEKTVKQEDTIASLQSELEQTNDELDKLNSTHLEERAQLIHDLQSCEREIDILKEVLADKDKEISVLSNNMTEYAEQILDLKQEIRHKEEDLVRIETALAKTELEAQIIKDHQSSDQQVLNAKITELTERLKTAEFQVDKAKEQTNLKTKEVEEFLRQVQEDSQTIQNLRGENQKLTVNHRNHLLECESQISSLKELVAVSSVKLQDSENLLSQIKETNADNNKLKELLRTKEQTFDSENKCLKEERNQLLAEASKHTTQLQALSKQLEDCVKSEEQAKKLLFEKLETITFLEQRLRETQEEAEGKKVKFSQELEAKDSDKEKLQESLQSKTEIISKLEGNIETLETANQQLGAALEKKAEELCEQTKLITGLNEKNTVTLQQKETLQSQVDNLLAENDKLQSEISDKSKRNLNLTEEQNTMCSQISVYEQQHSENQKVIEALQKDKEELTGRIEELRALEENKNSISASLLEKTSECNHLKKLLSESKESETFLQDQVSLLNAQAEELKSTVAEKDEVMREQNAKSEMLQEELEQLQEQNAALKAGLLEKESLLQQTASELNSLQNETLQQKDINARLQAESEGLRQCLGEREADLRSKAEECEMYMSKFNQATESVTSLTSRIDQMNKTTCLLESANVDIKSTLENQMADNGKLKEQLTVNQSETKSLQSHVQALNKENQELHAAIDNKEKELDEHKSQITELRERNDMNVQQISENKRIIQVLLHEKETLIEKTEELTTVIEANKNSFSESLLEKTNECLLLTKLLNDSKESIAQLNSQLGALNGQVEGLKDNVAEKDRLIRDRNANVDMQQSQLSQLQETLSLLQEQGTALKAGLMEKDGELQQKAVELSCLRSEIQKQEQLYNELQNEMKVEVGKHIADNNTFRESLSQMQVELVELQRHIQVLNEVNSQQKMDHQCIVVELSKKGEELIALQSELSGKNNDMNSLMKKIVDLESERENLHMSLHQKTESLNQQEMSIKQFKAQLEEGKSQAEIITELQSQIRAMEKSLEDKERSSQEKETELNHFKDKVMAESDVLKTQVNTNTETISHLQVELKQALEKVSELNLGIVEKEAQLKQKADDCLNLKIRCSELEDTALQLKSEVDSSTSECIQLKERLKEKEEALVEIQNTSLTNSDILNKNFNAKDAECESLKEQISALQEHALKMQENMSGQSSEIAKLREALAEKEAAVLEHTKALQRIQRMADEAALFKTQFMESTELVSELQSLSHKLSLECKSLNKHVEEKQSALSDLQEKQVIHLQELGEVKKLLSEKHDEIASLKTIVEGHNGLNKAAENTIHTLRSENSLLREELQHIQASHADLSKQKEDALATHQIHASALTVEIERLKSQHLQVAAQVNALTENLEQREMALHAINNQYTAQVKHAEHLVLELQKLEEQNKKLREEVSVTKDLQQQLNVAIRDKEHFQQEVLVTEKESLVKSYKNQIDMLKEELQREHLQELCGVNEAIEKMKSEKEHLQMQVSAKMEEITGLKLDIQKMTQILQESEKEWLSVLDREIQEKNLLTEQLKMLENEIKSKDVKVQTLQQDIDSLQRKNVDVTEALQISSEELKNKQLEALELSQQVSDLNQQVSAVHDKDKRITELDLAVKEKDKEVRTLELNKESREKDLKELSETLSSQIIALEEDKIFLQTTIKQLEANQQLELDLLRKQLDDTTQKMQETQHEVVKNEEEYQEKDKQLCLLQDHVKRLQEEAEINGKNLEEARVNQSSVVAEIQKKDNVISGLSVQLSQQKELLAALSQQLKEKDASVTQVMASASNEMMKRTEEKNRLLTQLENLENAHSCTVTELENVSIQLQESKAQLLLYEGEIGTKDMENKQLVKENDQLKDQYEQICKEKEVIKKKLQAVLIVRKDLMKKIGEYEKQKKENEANVPESAALEEKLKNLTLQMQTTAEDYESQIGQLKQQMGKKDDDISELTQILSAKESLLEELSRDMEFLQAKFSEQEEKLANTLQLLNEKCEIIISLQVSIAQKEETFDRERCDMMMKIDGLKEEMMKKEENLKAEISNSVETSLERENELAVVKQEKILLEKKVHAALVARKETLKKSQESEKRHAQEFSDLKEEFSKLLEQHAKQTDELNAMKLKYEKAVQGSVSFLNEELEASKPVTVEREKMLQSQSLSVAESQEEAMPLNQELERLTDKLQTVMSEISDKDALIMGLKDSSKQVSLQLEQMKAELYKTNVELVEKREKIKSQEQELNMAEEQHKYYKQAMLEKYNDLQVKFEHVQTEVEDLKYALETSETEKKQQCEELNKMNKSLSEELEAAHSLITRTSFELQEAQKASTEFQHQFCQEREFFRKELEKMQVCSKDSQCEIESNKLYIETLEKEKVCAFTALQSVKNELSLLKSELDESEKLKESLLNKLSMLEEKAEFELSTRKQEIQILKSYTEQLEARIKEKDDALSTFQAVVKEKEQMVATLEEQLQKEVHLREVVKERMKTVNELQQTSKEVQAKELSDETKPQEQITRKLQAALISRKEILKENRSLKENIQALKSENEEIHKLSSNLEKNIEHLKKHNEDLEKSVLTLVKEKEKLVSEVDRILSDNHNLSAACESLKLTIANITHEKQAFSCQLESLKDSQTVELSEWKSKHTELKQEYESLLQAYENVSSEMDKMRQILEVARKEKQEVLLKSLQFESEKVSLEKQVNEAEDEKEKLKEKMRQFTKSKQQKIQDLEDENEKIRKEFQEYGEKQKCTIENLTMKNSELESEINSLRSSSMDLEEKLSRFETDNTSLSEELKASNTLLEKWHNEAKSSQINIQLKLEEALNLNYTLTSKIEAQKADIIDKTEMIEFLEKEKLNLTEINLKLQKDHENEMNEKNNIASKLREAINKNIQEMSNLNEKIKILEDDKSLLQEELENAQEVSEKVKNENEYLETMLLKNAEKIDELTDAVNLLQVQNTSLSTQLNECKEERVSFCREKEQQQLKLVKDFEEKLKVLQRGSEGSKNVKKELQELLKEKHQEVNQLQHDCIKYQELILELEKSLTSSQAEGETMDKELEMLIDKCSAFEETAKNLDAEIVLYKNQLNQARDEITRVTSERDQLKEELKKNGMEFQIQMMEKDRALEKMTEEQKAVHKSKLMEFENQIGDLQALTERNTKVVMELNRQIESRDLQIKTLQAESATNLAKLAALSGNTQGDDLAKQWENIYQKTLEEKDKQVLEQGYVIMRFLEDIRSKDKSVHDLQVTIARLERSLEEYTVASTAQQTKLSAVDATSKELEMLTRQINVQNAQIEKLEGDNSLLNSQLVAKGELESELRLSLVKLKKMLSDLESQHVLVQAENDRLHVDLEKQEALSLQLKSLVRNKDSEISLLLSCRDGQMSEYLEQLQKHHQAQVEGYEDRLNVLYSEKEKADKAFRQLESKVKALQVKNESSVEEKEQLVTKLNTVKASLTSLQMEKEQLMSDNKILEAQHRNVMKEKECLVKEDLNENKNLKKEITALLHQMDDLNSENAMLKAQLIRYREDLNQVLTLKDNQLKELLKKQQDSIKSVISQKTVVENKLREALMDLQNEEEAENATKAQNANLASQVQQLQDEVLALKKEKAEMDETKVISDLQAAVATKAAECNDLQQKLFAQKVACDDLKSDMQQLQGDTKAKLTEANDKYSRELNAVKREIDLMRNEQETAENRVAELAGDLMRTEQLLSEARNQNKAIVSQNESLAKAMAALQDDRDHLIEDFKILRNKYDDELRETKAAMNKFERQLGDATCELMSLTKERYVLIQKLSAFESDNTYAQLTKQIDELCLIISDKEAELSRVSLENDSYSKQIAAFSGSMASLQDDRDRLIQELAKTKRGFESRQGTSPTTITPVGNEEISRRSNFDALQTERERLVKELEELRCENAEVAQTRLRLDELQRALQEAQAYREQMEVDMSRYQAELSAQKSENSRLLAECHSLKEQHVTAFAEQVGEVQRLSSTRGLQSIPAVKENMTLLQKEPSADQLSLLLAERRQLQHDLQRCLQEIQHRDLRFQQLNAKLLQTVEEKTGLSSQLKTVSQTLRDTQLNLGELQNRCYWLESQMHTPARQAYQDRTPGLVSGEVPPGAPQEWNVAIVDVDSLHTSEQRNRLTELEQQLEISHRDVAQLNERLTEERAQRQAVEDALVLAEERVKSLDSSVSRAPSREFAIQLESDEEREALIIDPTENIVTRKMKGGVLSCRRWLRGRSLYCSRLLMSRAKSRYLFLAYLLILHVMVFMCLTGSL